MLALCLGQSENRVAGGTSAINVGLSVAPSRLGYPSKLLHLAGYYVISVQLGYPCGMVF